MKITKSLRVVSIIMVVIALGLFVNDKPLLAQENPEELQSCNGAEGSVEDPNSQACVIRDCDCNRTANNGKVGELICMEARTVRRDDGAVQYVCKFPNSPTGVSCDTIGITCPGASSDSGFPVDNSTSAQTYDPNQPSTACEEKVIQWSADKACDGQYNRFVTLDRWQSSVFDPSTGKCKEFFLPNSVTDEKCGDSTGVCEPGPVDINCSEKVCLADGAEACRETWRDENCEVVTKIGKLTGQMCKSDAVRLDITSAVQTAAQGGLANDAQNLKLDIILGFKDRSTVHGNFILTMDAYKSVDATPKNIWDIAAIWLDGTRFTLNPNNYHESNFNLSSIPSESIIKLLTDRISENTYKKTPTVTIEFSDGSTRKGVLDITITPGWVDANGPKNIEQMANTLTQITIINPWTGDYFVINREEMMDFVKTLVPGEMLNTAFAYYIKVSVKFRDGTELTSQATLTVFDDSVQNRKKTIWDITGIEINGYNFTLNPNNIQANNFTFYENPEVIGKVLNLEVPTEYTKVPIAAIIKFQPNEPVRNAELLLEFTPGQVGTNPPRTITDALSNVQNVTLVDSYGGVYNFDSDLIRNGIGQVMNEWIPDGQMEITVPIDLTSVRGAHRYDNITLVYLPEGTSIPSNSETDAANAGDINDLNAKGANQNPVIDTTQPAAQVDNTQPAPQAPVELVNAQRICLVRSDSKYPNGLDCLGGFGGMNGLQCISKEAIEGGNLYIGFRFDDKTARYFQLEKVVMGAGNIDVTKTFMGLQEWGQNVSLYRSDRVQLPKDISVLPITIVDQRPDGKPDQWKWYHVNASLVDYTPRGCP